MAINQNFLKSIKKILSLQFGNVFRWRNNDDVTEMTFDFVIISLKNHNLAKSRNFRSPKSMV